MCFSKEKIDKKKISLTLIDSSFNITNDMYLVFSYLFQCNLQIGNGFFKKNWPIIKD